MGITNKAIYSKSFWSCYTRTIDFLARTTNTLEGWYRGFNALVNSKHPDLGKLVDCLRLELKK
jgi:hypothetical protein